ncbi:MAG: polysaccharide biosynthesis/export family protein [Cytophagales bacterium]|nr:polysaccharide biosynthesis/export family protein [Cytophagales bacterium]MDW8385175.1 polysaccharide biosynthesis/export family protein [Flammeovirgaceae bacterium]
MSSGYFQTFLYLIIIFLSSCSFRQRVLFRTKTEINPEAFEESYQKASKNYTIAELDYIAISVFTNKGERLIDPNQEFKIGEERGKLEPANTTTMGAPGFMVSQAGFTNNPSFRPINANSQTPVSYLVDSRGYAKLPLIGDVKLAGLSLKQADSLLSVLYSQWYEEPFVVTQYLNKRVILMGALGDKTIALNNEHMTLLEVLAIAGNFQLLAKPNKIRIIRGDLKNPSVQLVDLTTIEGLRRANLQIQPLDVIYVEPRRRIDRESFADIQVFLSLTTTLITTYLLFENLRK